MTRSGTMMRRGVVLAAGLALLVSVMVVVRFFHPEAPTA